MNHSSGPLCACIVTCAVRSCPFSSMLKTFSMYMGPCLLWEWDAPPIMEIVESAPKRYDVLAFLVWPP